jgi:hypothetical protein
MYIFVYKPKKSNTVEHTLLLQLDEIQRMTKINYGESDLKEIYLDHTIIKSDKFVSIFGSDEADEIIECFKAIKKTDLVKILFHKGIYYMEITNQLPGFESTSYYRMEGHFQRIV